jgi:predicted dehydrogenase
VTKLEDTGQKQAAWRTDPALAGISNCVGDIGSHIEFMAAYMTGLRIESLCARLDRFGADRLLDDNATVMVNYEGGARGVYWSSQVAPGHDNALRLRIYGTKGAVEWFQETPNTARVSFLDRPSGTVSRGRDPMSPRAQSLSRLPSGHPEGYFEGFANIYSTFITALAKKLRGEALTADDLDFPGVYDGVRGVRYIEKCVESSAKGSIWVTMA